MMDAVGALNDAAYPPLRGQGQQWCKGFASALNLAYVDPSEREFRASARFVLDKTVLRIALLE
jgi:hypothetical protein